MTKIITAKDKKARRLQCNLYEKANDPYERRKSLPGQHGARANKKISTWGKQLNAAQKFKLYYHLTEKQVRRAYDNAIRMKGDSGENFVGLLERRLDMVIFRLNFASSIFAAGQLVSHKHVLVNGQKVNIRSYLVKPGDIIELTEKNKQHPLIIQNVQKKLRRIPEYLEFEPNAFKAKFLRVPVLADIPYGIIMEPSLVIERYSK